MFNEDSRKQITWYLIEKNTEYAEKNQEQLSKLVETRFFQPIIDLVGEFEVFSPEKQQEIARDLVKLFQEEQDNILEHMKLFDENDAGYLNKTEIQNVFINLEIDILQHQFDYLIQKMFEQT